MTLGKYWREPAPINPSEVGVTEYGREDVGEIDQNMDVLDILLTAVNVHSFNTRKMGDFRHPKNTYPTKKPLALELPEGADPHGPILQLARAGITDCGFTSVISMDTTKPLTSTRTTDMGVSWIKALGKRGDNSCGIFLFVERSEDTENPRLQDLRESLSGLTVPRLTIVTSAMLGESPFPDEVTLAADMLKPAAGHPDVGPGMSIL